MENQVPEQIKTKRSNELLELDQIKRKKFEDYYIGKTVEVLVEEEAMIDGKICQTGHTKEYMKVAIEGNKELQNKLICTKIENHSQIIH